MVATGNHIDYEFAARSTTPKGRAFVLPYLLDKWQFVGENLFLGESFDHLPIDKVGK